MLICKLFSVSLEGISEGIPEVVKGGVVLRLRTCAVLSANCLYYTGMSNLIETVIGIIIIAWILGFVFKITGKFIHVLLIIALVMVVLKVLGVV